MIESSLPAVPFAPETEADKFNVLTTPWLDVIDLEACGARLSPLQAIERSAEIHRIVSPNPLDVFAAHRFLLTLLYWRADLLGGVDALRKSLIEGQVPPALVDAIRAEADHFFVFDEHSPFLQDPASRASKHLPASSLFAEMASGTNVSHFHHGEDCSSALCLRCAAMGLLRLVPWTQSGGAGKQPSLHNAPPIMALALGESLCQTLGLNLVAIHRALGVPQWTGQFKPTGKEIALLEALTWNPRRVHLCEPHSPRLCSRCGDDKSPTVGPIIYEKNPFCKQPDEIVNGWRDPAAFYRHGDYRTLKSSRDSDAVAEWDVRRVFDRNTGKTTEPAPKCEVVAANPEHDDWWLVIPCTNPANNKSFDHRGEYLSTIGGPPPQRQKRWDERVTWEAKDSKNLQFPSARPPTAGTRRFVSTAASLDGIAWGLLANARFRRLDEDTAAFDIFTGVYWPLRTTDKSLPDRESAWLALKLMAGAGAAKPAPGCWQGGLQPWMDLSVASSPAKVDVYPRRLTRDLQLEVELSALIARSTNREPGKPIDWPGLCQFITDATQ